MTTRRRLLVQSDRRRRTTTQGFLDPFASDRPPTPPPDLDDLPPYEPLELPLNDDATRMLAELANNRAATHDYFSQLSRATELLRETVSTVNDLFHERREELERVQERRRGRGAEQPSKIEIEIQNTVTTLTPLVPTVTKRTEREARNIIDLKIDLEDEQASLEWTSQQISERNAEVRRRRLQREARRQERRSTLPADRQAAHVKREHIADADGRNGEGTEDNEDDEEAGDGEEDVTSEEQTTSIATLLQEARSKRAQEYAQTDHYRKYGLNNDYIAFKQVWHDSIYAEGDVPVPHASTWFTEDGEPAPYGPGVSDNATNGDRGHRTSHPENNEDEDDIIVQREIISFKCPLMLVTMTEPYKSRVCNHTFEREGIYEYLRRGPMKCPQTGCDHTISVDDMAPDDVMRLRIERAEQLARRRNEAAATSDLEPDDDEERDGSTDPDSSLVEGSSRNVKRERQPNV